MQNSAFLRRGKFGMLFFFLDRCCFFFWLMFFLICIRLLVGYFIATFNFFFAAAQPQLQLQMI